jgi:ABC-type Mn2+/Zn2+ transport system permease subunit
LAQSFLDWLQGLQLFGKELWFPLHQACMGLALILSLVGLIPMLVDKGVKPMAEGLAHAIVGIIAVALAFVQPVLAFFRCAPGRFFLCIYFVFNDDI